MPDQWGLEGQDVLIYFKCWTQPLRLAEAKGCGLSEWLVFSCWVMLTLPGSLEIQLHWSAHPLGGSLRF